MDKKLMMSSSPHVRIDEDISNLMLDVVIALIPAMLAGIWVFGFRALIVTLTTVLSCVAFEALWNFVNKKRQTVGDFSAVVTGVLLAFSIPVSVPLWVCIVGGFFAIIIVKQFFGGLGGNFLNPALASRCFLLASFPVIMTTFVKPYITLPIFANIPNVDALTSATPLNLMKQGQVFDNYSALFFGNIGGCIGETSALALIIGGIYLVYRRVIRLEATLSYIIATAIFAYIFGYNGFFTGDALFHVLAGGLMIGAIFMITDYVTTPTTPLGNIIAGIIAGFLTIIIRVRGGYPESVSYAILLINVITPLIDKYIMPKRYGA